MNVQDLLRKFETTGHQDQCLRGKTNKPELTKSSSFCHGFIPPAVDELHNTNGIGKRKCIHEDFNYKSVACPMVVKSKDENGTDMEWSRRQAPMNVYGTINKNKLSADAQHKKDTDDQNGDNSNMNNKPQVAITTVRPVAPKKPPRTFAHDIYLRQKNNQTASPEVRKPAPPPKPPFYHTPNTASFRDRMYSMPQKMCPRPATRPSTPPPPRPPPSTGVASARTQWYESTNTIPRSSKGRNENKPNQGLKDRSSSSKHIYDEPTVETGPIRFPNNNFCNVANGSLQDKPRDLHYMSTPVYPTKKMASESSNSEAGSWNQNNNNETQDNLKSPTKKGFNLVRGVVNWSVSCIGQPMAPPS